MLKCDGVFNSTIYIGVGMTTANVFPIDFLYVNNVKQKIPNFLFARNKFIAS